MGPADAEPSWEEVQGLFRSMGCGRLLQRLDHLRGFLEDHRSAEDARNESGLGPEGGGGGRLSGGLNN